VAFHETGVDLEFKVNGEARECVGDPAYNERTRVHEYWFVFDPASVPAGEVTLSAIAHPQAEGHEPRVLEDVIVYAVASVDREAVWADAENGDDSSGNGTEAQPYATIKKAVEEA